MSKGFFSNMEFYTKIIKDNPVLSAEEFNELLPMAQKGSKAARERIILSNTAFIVKEAKKHENKVRSGAADIEDYIQNGWFALSECIDKFDLSKKNGFLTYASWYIKNRFGDVDYESNTITVPYGKLKANERTIAQPASIDEKMGEENDCQTKADFIPSYYDGAETEYENQIMLEFLDRRLSEVLSEEESCIIRYTTGIFGAEKYKMSEVGEILAKRRGAENSLSKQYVSVMKSRAIKKLQSDKELKAYYLAA